MPQNVRIIVTVAGAILLLVGTGVYLGRIGMPWLPVILWVLGAGAIAFALLKGQDWKRLRSSRSLYYGTSSTILTLAVVAIVVLVNVIADRDFHVRWDLTANRMYSLSEQTLQMLRELGEDVTVYAFVREGDPRGQQIVDLIREYVYRSDRIRLNVIDPDAQPSLARTYEVTAYNSVVVEAGDRRRTVQPFDIFGVDPFGQRLEFRGEQALTRAFLGVTRGSQGTVYFTTGHGERTLESDLAQLRSYLVGEGYEVKPLNLAESGEVPEDTTVLVIAGPQRDFDPREVEAVQTYIQEGGRAFVLIDPVLQASQIERIAGVLAPYGVTFRHDVVVDPERHYFIDPLSPIPSYEFHAVTQNLIEKNLGLVLPRTRSLAVEETDDFWVRTTEIFMSSSAAWGETTLQGNQVTKDDRDTAGPLALGVVVERRDTRVIALGSSSFITNEAIAFQGNVDFFVNAVNWLAGHEDRITIRPKTQEFRQVTLTGAQASVIFYSTVVFIPVLFLVGAGAIAWRRRHL